MISKVLYFGMSGSLGGIESFIINFWRTFDKDKVHVDFVKTEQNICFMDEIIEGGSQIFTWPLRRKNPIKYFISILLFLKSHPEYEIVHVHLNTCSSIEPAVLAKLCKRKVVVHSHNEWKGTSMVTKILHSINKPILNLAADVRLACSEAAGKWMFGNNNFTVIKNAICTNRYLYNEKKKRLIRQQLGIENKFVVGNVGRFVYQKNHKFLIEIFQEVHKKNKDSVLLLVGDGELRPQLENKIEELGLNDCVILAGVRNDVPDLLQAMDVFVFPSHFEGLGIVAIEAQAAGLPCIVSDTIPHEAFVTDSIESVCLNESTQNWAAKVNRCGDKFLRRDTSKEIIDSGYDILKSAKELEKIYILDDIIL